MYFCLVHLAFNVFQLTALMFGLVSERSSTCFKKKKDSTDRRRNLWPRLGPVVGEHERGY